MNDVTYSYDDAGRAVYISALHFLPSGSKMMGQLPIRTEPLYRTSDMVEIGLPDGTSLDVGWTPEHDDSGSFRIVLFREYWNDQVEEPYYTRDLKDVINYIRRLISRRFPH